MSTPAILTPSLIVPGPPPMAALDFPFVPIEATVQIDPADWRARIAANAPRASGMIFGWCVTSASYDNEPKVVMAKFGDGYAQRRPAGINTQARIWNIEMRNVTAKVRDAVLVFLQDRNGVDVFNWTPPLLPVEQQESVVCPSWTFAYGDLVSDGERLYTITMKFEEVHV